MPASTTSTDGLGGTLARIDDAEWLTLHLGLPPDGEGWTGLASVDAPFMRAWEQAAAERHRVEYGNSDPTAAAASALGWYAGIPGEVGGVCYQLARRVPRLGPESLALHRHPTELYPDGVALLDARFWCLPGDPAAAHPAATVVADEAALAAVLRAQVRAHADRFLAGHRPGARLPRRGLLGAFVDGLDVGLWLGARYAGHPRPEVPASAAAVLPGRTAEFRDATTLYLLVDDRDREHLTRERIACCFYYRVGDAGRACFTCPRTTMAERRTRAATWEEEP